MADFAELFNLQLMMFLLMGIGFVFRKLNIITVEGKKVITDLVIYLILPCNIIESFCIELTREVMMAGLTTICISIGIQALCSLMAAKMFNMIPKRQRVILQYGTVCSNAGFLGTPLAQCIYGPLGLLYASLYCIPQRIVMWTEGLSYFTESPDMKTVIRKLLTHPAVVSCFIGIVLMLTGWRFPTFIDNTLSSLSGCIAPITMLFIGAVLYDAGVKDLISGPLVYYTVVRLLIIPAITLIACLLLRLDTLASSVCVVLAAMPCGTMTALLANKYDGDEEFASRCIFVTTVLSMALLPAWCAALNHLL